MFFNTSNNNKDILQLLNKVEQYIKSDINKINENIDNKIDNEIYSKVLSISKLLEEKQREDLTIYGELMLCAEKLSDGITTDRVQLKSSNEKLNYIAKSINVMFSSSTMRFLDIKSPLEYLLNIFSFLKCCKNMDMHFFIVRISFSVGEYRLMNLSNS